MRTALENLIIENWDHVVNQSEEGLTQARSRELLIPSVVEYLAAVDRDLETEAKAVIDRVIGKQKRARGNSLRKDWEYILDYWETPEDAAQGVSALWEKAYPLGTSQGHDKALGRWSESDIHGVILGRYRDAAAANAAATEIDEVGTALISFMRNSGALTLQDVPAGVLI